MNSKIPLILFSCLAFSGTQAYAQCADNTRLNPTQVRDALSGKTVSFDCIIASGMCDPWMLSTSPDWHEFHQGDGSGTGTTLTEIGTGATGLQPTKDVGSWRRQGRNVVYSYTGDAMQYSHSVHLISGTIGASGSQYAFCLDETTHKATGTID